MAQPTVILTRPKRSFHLMLPDLATKMKCVQCNYYFKHEYVCPAFRPHLFDSVLSNSDSKPQSNQDTSGKPIHLNKSTDFLQDFGSMIFHRGKACTGYSNFKSCTCDKLKDANFSILQETNKLGSSKPKSNDSTIPSIGSSKSNKSNKSTSHTGGKSSATEKDTSSVTKQHEASKSHSNSAKSSSSSSHSATAKSHTKSKDSDKLSSSKPKSSDHLTDESKTNTSHTSSSKSKTKSESKVASSISSSDGKSCSNGHSKYKSKEDLNHSALINNVKSVAKKDQSQQKQDSKRSDSKSSSSKTSDDNSKSK